MSYRTCINDVQVFGNGEYYPEWIDFIKSQGIEIDEDGDYEGYITDFMGAVNTIEQIILRLNKEREAKKQLLGNSIGKNQIESLFDFTNKIKRIESQALDETEGLSIFDELFDIIEMTYAFMPYVFYQACESDLEPINAYSTPNHFRCFKLKKGAKIHVKAS